MPKKEKNFWYWAGQVALGVGSIAVTFSDNILGASFPEHTWVNQMAIPIGAGVKLLWDRVLYQKNALPGKLTNKVYDKVPNAFTGLRGSKLTSDTNADVVIARFASDSDTTVGALYIDEIQQCYIVEDQYQSIKVAGETRIPAGIYRLGFRTENSSMNEQYKEKYSYHQGMIEILDIPNFTDVYIHIGNDDDDTAGCLLPNMKLVMSSSGIGFAGQQSTVAYEKVYKKIAGLMKQKAVHLRIDNKDIRI